MVLRSKVVLAHAVTVAGVEQLAGAIDAQVAKHVLGPAEAVGVVRQPALGGEHAVAAACCDLVQEVDVVAEQAEAVLDFPDDAKVVGSGNLCDGTIGVGKAKKGAEGQNERYAHFRPGAWALVL